MSHRLILEIGDYEFYNPEELILERDEDGKITIYTEILPLDSSKIDIEEFYAEIFSFSPDREDDVMYVEIKAEDNNDKKLINPKGVEGIIREEQKITTTSVYGGMFFVVKANSVKGKLTILFESIV